MLRIIKKKIKYLIYDIYLRLNTYKIFKKIFKKFFDVHLISMGYCLDWNYLTSKSNNHIFQGENLFISKLYKLDIKYFYDVGANIGDYSNEILKIPNSKVVAIEPLKKCYVELLKIKKKYPDRFTPLNIALSNIKKKDFIYFANDKSELASIEKKINKIDFFKNYNNNKKIIQINTLDNIFKKNKTKRLDFLKIDTEGNEKKVLKGSSKLIKNKIIKIIQLEFNLHHLTTNDTIFEITNYLKDYLVFQLNLINGKLLKIDPSDPLANLYYLSNFIFIEKDFYKSHSSIIHG
jgi:FkbM family methyltransferase